MTKYKIQNNNIKDELKFFLISSLNDKFSLKKLLTDFLTSSKTTMKMEHLYYIAKNTNDFEVFNEITSLFEFGDGHFRKELIIASYASKMDNIKKSIEILKAIPHSPWANGNKIKYKAISNIIPNFQDIDEANNLIETISDKYPYEKSKAFLNMKSVNDNRLTNEILKLSEKINDKYEKAEILSILSRKDHDPSLGIEAFKLATQNIESDWEKEKAISAVRSLVNVTDYLNKMLDIVRTIKCNTIKSSAQSIIALSVNDYQEASIIANNILDLSFRIQTFSKIHSKRKGTFFYSNFLYIKNFNKNFPVFKSIDYVLYFDFSNKAILKYYGLSFGILNATSIFDEMIVELETLKIQRDSALESGDEKSYDDSFSKAQMIQKKILEDEKLLGEFLSIYKIKKMEFKNANIFEIV